MPSILNINEFCENLKEITTSKTFDKKNFHSEGLFSEQIFGPLKNYTCQCGTYFGISGSGGTCGLCGVDIVSSTERRRRFAKIVLPLPVINPLFYDLLIDLAGPKSKLRDALDQLIKKEDAGMFKDPNTNDYIVTRNSEVLENQNEVYYGVEAVKIMIENLTTDLTSNDTESDWIVIKDNIDQLIIQNIIVLPPDLRPASKNMTKGKPVNIDQINKFYRSILTKKEIMEETRVELSRNQGMKFSYYRQIQNQVNELYSFILDKLSKKEGLIRGNILGKRIDFSGRAVITPDPTLKLNECSLPYFMVLELFKIKIAKKLIYLGKFKLFNKAVDFVDNCIETNSTVLYNICTKIVENEVCMLNRQPSLHKLSVLGFYVKVGLENVIKIHPLVCPPFNADFDGDQMAVYIPVSDEAKQEVIDKILVSNNLINPANGLLSTKPSHEMVLGIYVLTTGGFNELNELVEYKDKKITLSRKIFNECLPDDYDLIDEPVNSKKLQIILTDIKKRYNAEVISDVLDNIKMIGFKYSTLYGSTMSLDDIYIKDYEKLKNEIYSKENIIDQLKEISSPKVEQFLKDNFKYAYMIESGSRGTWDQARQIVFTRGFISNFDGEIIPDPIKSNYVEGMTPIEFFHSTYGARKGLLDVALNTGISGYLSRKLIFTCVNLLLSEDIIDCGTNDYLSVFVKDVRKSKMLVGKWMKGDNNLEEITDENHSSLIGKTILVRSPIYCTSERVCQTCYGEMYKIMNSIFVGIIAAQSIGECNTQLVLRTFHKSGVASFKDGDTNNDMKQQDIINDLSLASKLLHNNRCKDFETLVSNLFDIYNTGRPILHVHFECVVSQLMWNGSRKWRLLSNRDKAEPQFQSVQQVPSQESWLMGLAFSNPRKHIIRGILNSGRYEGIFDRMLCGDKV